MTAGAFEEVCLLGNADLVEHLFPQVLHQGLSGDPLHRITGQHVAIIVILEFGADGYRAFPGNAPEQEALSDRTYAEEHLIPEETMFTIGNKPYMVDRVDLDSLTVHYQYIGGNLRPDVTIIERD